MKRKKKIKFSHYLLGCLAGLTIGAIVVELGCRVWILSQPPASFRFRAGLPQFEYVDSVPSAGGFTIGSKREVAPRDGKRERVALLGDAVAACAGISDSSCFSEKLQAQQTRFDIYNFGVPGYGLPEIEAVNEGLAASAKFSTVIYVATADDVVDSLPFLLSMQRDPKYRFVDYANYDRSPHARLKALAHDFYKAAWVLHYFGTLESSSPSLETLAQAGASEEKRQIASREACTLSRKDTTTSTFDWPHRKSLDVLKTIYSDEKVLSKLEAAYERIAASARRGGLRFIVAPFYDREMLENEADFLEPVLKRLTSRSGLELADTRSFFSTNASDCSLYLDDSLGFSEKGSERFAAWLAKNVLQISSP